MTSYYILFPAYNEDKVIAQILEETHQLFQSHGLIPLEMIVVDDGSKDRTGEIVKSLQVRLPVKLLQHQENKGLGGALKTGLMDIIPRTNENDIILTTESDGCQDIHKLILITKEILNGANFAVATPLLGTGSHGVPFHRRFLSHTASIIYSTLFPIKNLIDYTNLNRAFRADVLKKGLQKYGEDKFIDKNGFEAVPDIILKLRTQLLNVAHVPVNMDFSKAKRDSSMDVLKTIRSSLKLCWDHLFNIREK